MGVRRGLIDLYPRPICGHQPYLHAIPLCGLTWSFFKIAAFAALSIKRVLIKMCLMI